MWYMTLDWFPDLFVGHKDIVGTIGEIRNLKYVRNIA